MSIGHNVANVILHVILLAAAIALLFFVYGSIVEQKVVTSQVDNLVSGMTADLKAMLSDSDKQNVMEAFKNLVPPDMSTEDKTVAASNKKLITKAAAVIGVTFIIGISAVVLLSWVCEFSFLDMLKENIVILLVAIAIEVIFLSFFAKNFKSLDPNIVKASVVKSLQIYASSS